MRLFVALLIITICRTMRANRCYISHLKLKGQIDSPPCAVRQKTTFYLCFLVESNLSWTLCVFLSAGVGRTGVFITLSIVLERMRYEGVVDLFQTVKTLRTQRPAMVQTEVRHCSSSISHSDRIGCRTNTIYFFGVNYICSKVACQRGPSETSQKSPSPEIQLLKFRIDLSDCILRQTMNASLKPLWQKQSWWEFKWVHKHLKEKDKY